MRKIQAEATNQSLPRHDEKIKQQDTSILRLGAFGPSNYLFPCLRDMLLEHCYSTNSTFPVCFVPDSEITRISVYTASDKCRENDKSDSDTKSVSISFLMIQ